MNLVSDFRVVLEKLHRRHLWKNFTDQNQLADNECGLVVQGGIGDHILVCGLANAVAQKHGSHVVVAAHPKYEFIIELFSSVRRFISLPARLTREVVGAEEIKCGRFAYAYYRGNDLFRVAGYNNFQLIDAFKCLLGLKPENMLEHPRLPCSEELAAAETYLAQHQLTRGKIAILCTEAGLTPTGNVGVAFWERLSRTLTERGITPILNQGPKSSQIVGVRSLAIPLPLFRAVALTAGHFYGVRSGICDLVCDLDCHKCIIYPKTKYWFGSVYAWANFTKYCLARPPSEIILDYASEQALLSNIRLGLISENSS
jgi:hypothetical protein